MMEDAGIQYLIERNCELAQVNLKLSCSVTSTLLRQNSREINQYKLYYNVPQTFQHRLVPDWTRKAMGLQQGPAQASKTCSTRRELFQMVFSRNCCRTQALLQMQENGDLHRLKVKWWKQKRGGGRCQKSVVKSAEVKIVSTRSIFLGLFCNYVPGAGSGQPGRDLCCDFCRRRSRLHRLHRRAPCRHLSGLRRAGHHLVV